jgi:hypothetical protein
MSTIVLFPYVLAAVVTVWVAALGVAKIVETLYVRRERLALQAEAYRRAPPEVTVNALPALVEEQAFFVVENKYEEAQ